MADDDDETTLDDGMMENEDGGVHGRKANSKRPRMMTELTDVQCKEGPKSTTWRDPSNGDDSDSSQLTLYLGKGSGKSNGRKQIMNSHGSSSGGE